MDRTLPPVTLTPEEAAAAAVALSTRLGGPGDEVARAALDKVLGALDPEGREEIGRLAERVGGRSRVVSGTPGVHRSIERALTRGRVLALGYRDSGGRVTHRRVEPQLLARTGAHWYLVAWCLERDAVRWFRCDRITAATGTPERAARRDPASLGATPQDRPPGRPPRSAAHPAGRRRTGPPVHEVAPADEQLAPVRHLRSVR